MLEAKHLVVIISIQLVKCEREMSQLNPTKAYTYAVANYLNTIDPSSLKVKRACMKWSL